MNPTLWRGADPSKGELAQPGDKDDERDERCVAIKDVGNSQQGVDSFVCDPDDVNKYMKDYAICIRPIG